MALIWMDGFDHYDGAQANLSLGNYSTVESNITLSTEQARTGTHSLSSSSNSNNGFVFGMPTPLSTFGVGLAVYISNMPGSTQEFIAFEDNIGAEMCTLVYNSSGALSLRRGSWIGTVIGETGSVLPTDSWIHIEFKIHISQTVGGGR